MRVKEKSANCVRILVFEYGLKFAMNLVLVLVPCNKQKSRQQYIFKTTVNNNKI